MDDKEEKISRGIEQEITITLAVKQWLPVLAGLNTVVEAASRRIDEIRAQGIDPRTLDPAEVTALSSPMFARARIVTELAAKGHMTSEAAETMGIAAIERLLGVKID